MSRKKPSFRAITAMRKEIRALNERLADATTLAHVKTLTTWSNPGNLLVAEVKTVNALGYDALATTDGERLTITATKRVAA